MRLVKIRDIGRIISGSTPKTDVDEYWNGSIPWVTPKEISQLPSQYLNDTERKITELGFRDCSTTMIPKGNVLFTSRAPIGLVAINNIDVCTNQGFKSIILNRGFYALYIYYALRAFSKQLNNLGTGTTFKELSKATFEKFEIPVPGIDDQIRIATVLSKAEALITKREESIHLLDEFLKSTFLEMFGDPVTNTKRIERRTIGELTNRIVVGHVGPTSHGYTDKGIPFLRTQNVRENFINYDDIKFITEEFYLTLKKSIINEGDVLISRVWVNRGMAAVVPRDLDKANCANVVIIGKTAKLDSLYLAYYFNFTFSKKPEFGASVGSAQGVINTSIVKKWPIILAPLKLQNQFARIVEKTEALKSYSQTGLIELENLYRALSQRAFKGELDLRELHEDDSELVSVAPEINTITTQKKTSKNTTEPPQIQETVAMQGVANKIIENYKGFHFSFEMLHSFIEREKLSYSDYFSSEEMKKNPKLNVNPDDVEDLKNFVTSAIVNRATDEQAPKNPWIKLNQIFYDASKPSASLNLKLEDLEKTSNRSIEDQSGIYFEIVS